MTPAELLRDVMGIPLDEIPLEELDYPVIEPRIDDDPTQAYVKFMSHCGRWDDLLGNRFAEVSSQQGAHFDRQHRPRSGWIDLTKLPRLYEWYQQEADEATEDPAQSYEGPWVCFHCGETCSTRQQAIDHFGYDELELPLCIEAATKTQQALIEDRRDWRERCREAEAECERIGHCHHHLLWDVREIISREAKRQNIQLTDNLSDFKWLWETMEGRALAAEAALDAAPKWLASWLRRRAERIGIKKMRAER